MNNKRKSALRINVETALITLSIFVGVLLVSFVMCVVGFKVLRAHDDIDLELTPTAQLENTIDVEALSKKPTEASELVKPVSDNTIEYINKSLEK
jgi:hypothetical protein